MIGYLTYNHIWDLMRSVQTTKDLSILESNIFTIGAPEDLFKNAIVGGGFAIEMEMIGDEIIDYSLSSKPVTTAQRFSVTVSNINIGKMLLAHYGQDGSGGYRRDFNGRIYKITDGSQVFEVRTEFIFVGHNLITESSDVIYELNFNLNLTTI